MLDILYTIITYLSYFLLLKTILKFAYFIYRHFFRPRINHIEKYGKNSWALITGGSDGIGKAVAIELARAGFNILVASRTESKLVILCEELKKNYRIDTDYIAVDFDNIDQTYKNYENLFEKHFKNKQISILVNNIV